jgi:O-antigen/teichoic acid export membrane protein
LFSNAEVRGSGMAERTEDIPAIAGGAGMMTTLASGFFKRAMAAARVVRLTPFDTATEDGRSKERYRRAALTTLASFAAKGVQVLTMLISVPLTLHYLGAERYGMWMTISSFVVLLNFADLGLGLGLLNAIAEAHGRDDREAARRAVSSAFFMLAGIATVLGALFALAYSWVPWPSVFNVSDPAAVSEAGPALAVFAACFLCSLPLSIVNRVQLGYQEGFANSLWEASGNLLGLAAVIAAVRAELSLPWLVAAMSGAPLCATCANWTRMLVFKRPWLRPAWASCERTCARRIIQAGWMFFALQIGVSVLFAVDNIIIARMLGPVVVTEYAVTWRLFSVIVLAASMFLGPLWPAYAEALARGDGQWIRRTFRLSLTLVSIGAPLAALTLILTGSKILRLWIGPGIEPSRMLFISLGIWAALAAIGNSWGVLLNGIKDLRFQLLCLCLLVPFALTGKILGAMWMGLPGVAVGSFIAYGVCTVIPVAVRLSRVLPRLCGSVACHA